MVVGGIFGVVCTLNKLYFVGTVVRSKSLVFWFSVEALDTDKETPVIRSPINLVMVHLHFMISVSLYRTDRYIKI